MYHMKAKKKTTTTPITLIDVVYLKLYKIKFPFCFIRCKNMTIKISACLFDVGMNIFCFHLNWIEWGMWQINCNFVLEIASTKWRNKSHNLNWNHFNCYQIHVMNTRRIHTCNNFNCFVIQLVWFLLYISNGFDTCHQTTQNKSISYYWKQTEVFW